jgi:ABC-type nitrate/sulfonate/bicarbonate transport system permease component
VTIVAVWQIWVDATHPPVTMIASPSQIVAATVRSSSTLWPAALMTFTEGVAGFLIACLAGVLLGVGIHCSRTAYAALFPLLTAAQTLPLISIAPLFLIWFGFEPAGKIVIVAVFALFPIVVQTMRGLQAVPRFYDDVAMTCGASRAWTLFHVDLRVAARQIFGGVRVSAAYVFATAATAEYLGARTGLGIWLQAAYNSFQTPLIFTATFVIIVMTGLLLLAVRAVERLTIGSPADDEDPDAQ